MSRHPSETSASASSSNMQDPDAAPTTLEFIIRQLNAVLRHVQEAERLPVWLTQDTAMMARAAETSRTIFANLISLSATRPALAAAMKGRFLDAGVGDGALVIAAADRCPDLKIVGLDVWEPAVATAREKVALSSHADRIQLRLQDMTQIVEREAFSLIWLPSPFLPKSAAPSALDRLTLALRPNGYLVIGRYAPPPGDCDARLGSLEVMRSSSQCWESGALVDCLRERGFRDIETHPGPPNVELTLGRRSAVRNPAGLGASA